MGSRYSLGVDGRKVAAAVRRVPAAVLRNMTTTFKQDGEEFRSAMSRSFVGWDGNVRNTGDRLRARSKFLRDAMNYRVEGADALNTLALKNFIAGVPYARIQELGGVVVPVKNPSGYLTIPIDDNLHPSGIVKFPSARSVIEDGGFFLRLKSGGLYIVKHDGDDLLFLFKLVRRVRIPPRLKYAKTWRGLASSRSARRTRALNRAVQEAVKGG